MNAFQLLQESPSLVDTKVISRGAFDHLSEGVIITDDAGVIVYCNRSGLRILDAPVEVVVGRNLIELSFDAVSEDGEPLSHEQSPIFKTLTTGITQESLIMGISAGGKSRRWVAVDASPVIVDGAITGAVSTFTDVTDRLLRSQMLALLPELNRQVMSPDGDVDLLQHLCDVLFHFGGYRLAYVAFPESDSADQVVVEFAAGATEFLSSDFSLPFTLSMALDSPLLTALHSGEDAVMTVERLSTGVSPQWRQRAKDFGLGSAIAVPFRPAGRNALLVVYASFDHATSPARVNGLKGVVTEVEFGVQHRQAMADLESFLNGTLTALGLMTEARDPYTAGHQSRVGSLGMAIALHLGLDAKLAKLIGSSGDVHDIGKIAIPSEILTRPGKLSAIEYGLIQEHTKVGFKILSGARAPWPIAEVALSHHERLNGSGYPYGLTADEIIVPARIIAVADVVEAMTQHRPYRPARGLEAALDEVRSGAGTLFDAEVVKACLALFEAGFRFPDQPVESPFALE